MFTLLAPLSDLVLMFLMWLVASTMQTVSSDGCVASPLVVSTVLQYYSTVLLTPVTESLPVIKCTVAVLWIRFQGLTSLTRATAFAVYTSSFEENCAALQRGAPDG